MNISDYRTRFILLVVGVPLLLLLSWNLSLSQTFEIYRELKKIKSSALLYPHPEQTLEKLNRELDLVYSDEKVDPQSVDERLMKAISEHVGTYHILLEEIPETHSYSNNSYTVQTFRVRFSGRFANLLKFIHYAEYEIHSCSIVSLEFSREYHKKRGEKLFADIYFQSVYKSDDHDDTKTK